VPSAGFDAREVVFWDLEIRWEADKGKQRTNISSGIVLVLSNAVSKGNLLQVY
jgi:hypothetical protein